MSLTSIGHRVLIGILFVGLLTGTTLAQPAPPATTPAGPAPWRAQEAVRAPRWLRFGVEHRVRYENLDDDFRSAATGDVSAFSLRTLVSGEIGPETLAVGAEMIDSRAYASDRAILNTTIVDATDLLQGYVAYRPKNLLQEGDALNVKLGRITIDLGSRRLVARNDFRNTINAFTGGDVQWRSAGGHVARVFLVAPVGRLPTDQESLEDNEVKADKENFDAILWSLTYTSPTLFAGAQIDAYVIGFDEDDDEEFPSTNRRLFTPGVRVMRASQPGHFGGQVEAMGQVGESRATTAADDDNDLDHRAFSVHVSGGYRTQTAWTPRAVLQFDYASGDDDPDDDSNERFDTLFGARRFEFGPTGFYGAFARSNIISPGLRIEVTPHSTVDAFAAYRPFWLASKQDAWTTSALRDPEGDSGRFLGHQIEGRIRWQIFPRNVAVDVGAAHLIRGGFAEDAPKAKDDAATFLYGALTLTI